MATGVKTKYHIALNGNGFMLRGAPGSPKYIKDNAPVIVENLRFAERFGLGDFTESQLNGNGWSFWTQTDWTGSFQTIKWKDDGSFRDGQAIDPIVKFGNVSIQNAFTSGASISGSHSYGDSGVHDGVLLLGTIKGTGAAKLFKVTSANVVSQISASVGISAFNSMDRYQKYTLMGLSRLSGSLKTLVGYNGSTLSSFRSSAGVVRSVHAVGIRAYISEFNTKLSGDVLMYTTSLSAFTSAYNAGKNIKITKINDLGGSPYFITDNNGLVNLWRWDELAQRAYPIYEWGNLTGYGVRNYLSYMIISGTSNGKSVAYAFNGARLVQIFNDQLLDATYDFSKPFEFKGNLQLKGAQWNSENWYPGLYGKFANVQYTPFVNFNNKAYGYAVTGSLMRLAYSDTTKYNLSGYVISSQYGGQIGGVDKLLNSVYLDFDTLVAGQTVEVLRTFDEGTSYTSVGKASFTQDGAVNTKRIYFSSGLTAKLWNYKVVLVGNGNNTPVLQDITHEFKPFPDLKKRWQLSVDAGDDIRLLNKQKEQRDGKALMGQIWLEKELKRTVVYEDVDGYSVSFVSAMAAADTSAKVNNTRFMPPKGRVRVVKSGIAEEMTYTSADGNIVKGITRGRQTTLARAYTSADTMDNFYTVTVSSIREEVNDTDQDKTESIARLILLEV